MTDGADRAYRLENAWRTALNIWIQRFKKSQQAIRELEDEQELTASKAYQAGWTAALWQERPTHPNPDEGRAEAWCAWWDANYPDGT